MTPNPESVIRVFPARAGMILIRRGEPQIRTGIPRESGDDPKLCIEDFIQNGYSPRERG